MPPCIQVRALAHPPPVTSLTSVGLTASGTTPLPTAHCKTIVVAPGLPALDRTMVELILAELFVDLAELPPAKGHAPAATNRPLDSLTQPANPVKPKRLIPDLGTWVQCFSLYTAVLLTKHPHRATSIMLYQKNIGYLSQRFRWPTWVLYDYSFWQETADLGKIDWSQLDYGLHAKYFHHINSSLDAWCSICHSGEHRQGNCPLTDQKQPSTGEPIRKHQNTSQSTAPKRSLPARSLPDGTPICHNFNFGNGVCRFGPKCTFAHVCWRCQGPHPMTRNDHPIGVCIRPILPPMFQ